MMFVKIHIAKNHAKYLAPFYTVVDRTTRYVE